MPPTISQPVQAALPAPEALTLAASIFHADVDAWLPANFGVTRSTEAKEAEWAAARSYSGGERLGVGHPDAADPEARRRAQSSRAGAEVLRKVVKKRKGGDEEAAAANMSRRRDDDDDDGEEEESRTKAVASKKKRKTDAFKSKNSAVHPLLNLKNPIPGYDAPAAPALAKPASKKLKMEVDDSVNAAAALAAILSTGVGGKMSIVSSSSKVEVEAEVEAKSFASKITGMASSSTVVSSEIGSKVSSSEVGDEGEKGEAKSKAALRREKRKRQKAAKRAAGGL